LRSPALQVVVVGLSLLVYEVTRADLRSPSLQVAAVGLSLLVYEVANLRSSALQVVVVGLSLLFYEVARVDLRSLALQVVVDGPVLASGFSSGLGVEKPLDFSPALAFVFAEPGLSGKAHLGTD
jgi:hypothetical protein